MPRRAKLFIATIAVIAAGLAVSLPAPALSTISPGTGLSIALFVVVAILAEAMAINLQIGLGDKSTSSLAFLPFLASFVLFEPVISISIVALATGVTQFILRRNDFVRGLFNVSQGVISSGLAATSYTVLLQGADRLQVHWLGFLTAAGTFFALNILLSSVAVAIVRSQSLRTVLSQMTGPRGSNLLYDLMASPIALLPVALYDQYHFGGLLVIVLPLILIRYSYLSKVQLEEANRDLLHVLIKAIETRDPYTSGHSVRVATLAKLVAQDLGLGRRAADVVETAALLHDIGKIDSAYEAIIRKPHHLTGTERDLIRTHATRGADLLQSLRSVNSSIVHAVRHHHEHYDGTGYPSGLSGAAIPLPARIIMICDSVDAMLSDRPYRSALSIENTRGELIRCAGTQFDPSIVRVILSRNTLERAASLVLRQPRREQHLPAFSQVG